MITISTEIVKIGKLHKKVSNSTSQTFHPETEISQIVDFPETYGNDGKYLTTNNGELSWANADAFPTQTNNAGKFLRTDGTNVEWSDILNEIKISSIHYPSNGDTTITLNSNQTIPAIVNKYTMSVYRNGIYLISSIDYGFNHSNNTITFNKAFGTDEVVSVLFTYLSTDSTVNLDLDVDEYEAGNNITFTNNAITNKVIINANDQLPSQTNNSGKFLTTDGSDVSWEDIDAFPDQTNNSGKFLTTNGSVTSWAEVDAFPDQTNNDGKFLRTDGTDVLWDDIFAGEVKVNSVHYPNENDTTITLTSIQVPTVDITKWGLSIYRNGIYLTQNIDYTYNSSTRVLTFTRAFELNEQVNVNFAYLSTDADTNNIYGLPSQTGNANKILTTDGSVAYWNNIFSKYNTVTITTETNTVTIPNSFFDEEEYTDIAVYLDGIKLVNNTDYTYNTHTITFVDQLLVGDVITYGVFTASGGYDALADLNALNNLGTGVLTSDGTSLAWKNFNKLIYVQDTTAAGEQITVPVANLTDAVITEVYRNGLLMVNPDDYTINTTTGDITFVQAIIANEKIVVITQKAVVNTFTYESTATTQPVSDNSNNVATTAFVTNKIASYNYTTSSDVETAINNRFANPIEKVNVLTSSATITISPNSGSLFMLALSTDASISIDTISNGPYTTNGATITLYLNNTSYTITWGNSITWMSGSAPDVTSNPAIITFVTFNGGTTWYGSSIEIES